MTTLCVRVCQINVVHSRGVDTCSIAESTRRHYVTSRSPAAETRVHIVLCYLPLLAEHPVRVVTSSHLSRHTTIPESVEQRMISMSVDQEQTNRPLTCTDVPIESDDHDGIHLNRRCFR